MALPKDFWEEFDRRLDTRFSQFRIELDGKFAKIDEKFKKTNEKINQVINWTQRQDLSIERDSLSHYGKQKKAPPQQKGRVDFKIKGEPKIPKCMFYDAKSTGRFDHVVDTCDC